MEKKAGKASELAEVRGGAEQHAAKERKQEKEGDGSCVGLGMREEGKGPALRVCAHVRRGARYWQHVLPQEAPGNK